jgi:DNA-binding response OmpR family regulator
MNPKMPCVLVVDDERATNDSHRDIVETLGNVLVVQATDYAEAKRKIQAHDPDLLLLDIDLGGRVKGEMQGFELLKEYGGRIPAVIVTGMQEDNLQTIALTLKAYEFVRKPAKPIDLLNKVKHALNYAIGDSSERAEEEWPEHLAPDADRPPNLLWRGKPVALTLTELTIVHCLARNAGRTVGHDTLIDAMKTGDSVGALAQHMVGVRKKFTSVDKDFNRIKPDPGVGYRWLVDA